MTALMDRRSPAQVAAEADQEKRRDALRKLVEWLADPIVRPPFVTDELILPAVEKHVGHPVDIQDLVAVIAAGADCDHLLWHRREIEFARAQHRYERALDTVLDVVRCEACGDAIDRGSLLLDCNDTGASFCSDDCHGAYHAGAPCDAGSYR